MLLDCQTAVKKHRLQFTVSFPSLFSPSFLANQVAQTRPPNSGQKLSKHSAQVSCTTVFGQLSHWSFICLTVNVRNRKSGTMKDEDEDDNDDGNDSSFI